MNSNHRVIVAAAAILLSFATLFGALGAHALQSTLSPEKLASYDVAVRYQFFHALGLLAIGVASRSPLSKTLLCAVWLICAGILLFSGSIYALSFGAPRIIGPITPLGGLALICGWLLFAIGYWNSRSQDATSLR